MLAAETARLALLLAFPIRGESLDVAMGNAHDGASCTRRVLRRQCGVPSTWLATMLDQEQIDATAAIAPRSQPVETMPDRLGADVATEIGRRFLIRYLVDSQINEFLDGSTDRDHWVTPTAIAPEAAVSWLALFAPKLARQHVLVLDAAKIDLVRGPAWIRGGQGIEYYLPGGFPQGRGRRRRCPRGYMNYAS